MRIKFKRDEDEDKAGEKEKWRDRSTDGDATSRQDRKVEGQT